MTSLTAGDRVLSGLPGGDLTVSRVITNQHLLPVPRLSTLLTIHFDGGSLTVTPDHMLYIDHSLHPARAATVGSWLDDAKGGVRRVSAVTMVAGAIINPHTTAGTIVAAGAVGAPILATTYGEWIADAMPAITVQATISHAISLVLPHSSQAFSDLLFGQALSHMGWGNALIALKQATPVPLYPAAVVFCDLALTAAFALFMLFQRGGAALAALVVTATFMLRRVAAGK